ncbi:MAG: HEPN domain-containing protein [Anaerolineales bacterium]|nr:HEPN domain-containing protein [Anaerolineales bacterium]
MPLEQEFPGSAKDWLRYARGDLQLARTRKTSLILYAALCFHAQQAAEKSLKAVLIGHGIPFPRTHNLRTLLDLMVNRFEIPDEVQTGRF